MQLGCSGFLEKKTHRWPRKHQVFKSTKNPPQVPPPRAVRHQCLVSSQVVWNDGPQMRPPKKLNPNSIQRLNATESI